MFLDMLTETNSIITIMTSLAPESSRGSKLKVRSKIFLDLRVLSNLTSATFCCDYQIALDVDWPIRPNQLDILEIRTQDFEEELPRSIVRALQSSKVSNLELYVHESLVV